MKRPLIWLMLAMVLVSCGKNDAFYPIGQAPVPGGYYPPTGYPPLGGGGFVPQLPPGYPQQYTPFLPIDYYMRQDPSRSQYWGQFWSGWQQYAGYRGYPQYDFNRFWYEYCPQQWQGTQFQTLYGYFNHSFYSWGSPSMQFSSQMDPYYFWQGYMGYSYDPYSCSHCF